MDIAHVLLQWRRRPAALVAVLVALLATTGAVVAVGGPPTPVTHLY